MLLFVSLNTLRSNELRITDKKFYIVNGDKFWILSLIEASLKSTFLLLCPKIERFDFELDFLLLFILSSGSIKNVSRNIKDVSAFFLVWIYVLLLSSLLAVPLTLRNRVKERTKIKKTYQLSFLFWNALYKLSVNDK